MLGQLTHVFINVIVPLLLLTGAGAALQKFRPLSVPTLSTINIYLFVPAFLFVRVAESTLSWAEIGGVVAAVLLPMALLGLPLFLILRARQAPGNLTAAVLVGGLVFNAGNFGIPVAELAFGAPGGAVQALVVMMSNFSIWCVAYAVIALSQGHGLRGAAGFFKLPMIYTLALAFWVREADIEVPAFIHYPLNQLALAVVPLGLVTLGAQIAERARIPHVPLLSLILFLKLAALPAVTAVVVYYLGLWPWPGAQLILASAAPTAVNTLLLTLELKGDADLAADAIFWTTLGSAATVTGILWLLTSLGGHPPPGL